MINKVFCDFILKIIQKDVSLEKELDQFNSWTPITIVLFIISEFDEFPKSCNSKILNVLEKIMRENEETQTIEDKLDFEIEKICKIAIEKLQKEPKKVEIKKVQIRENVIRILNSVKDLPEQDFHIFLSELRKDYNLEIKIKKSEEIIEDYSIIGVLNKIINTKLYELKNLGVKKEEAKLFLIYLNEKISKIMEAS
jgi:hypothetical protein